MPPRAYQWVPLAHLTIAVLIVAAATLLGVLHDLSPDAVTAIFGMGVGAVTGSSAAQSAMATLVNGKNIVSTERLQQIDDTHARERQRLETVIAETGVTPPPAPPAPPER